MRVVSRKYNGKKETVVVELDADEDLLAIRKNSFYKLGDPVNDIISSHHLVDSVQVYWCSVTQEWITT